ncbi:MAG: hypothetical protein GEU78_07210 [Actinobacteria bacterium]|nr:hypothetical protein [Actinomycetota bacterium]
MRAKKRVVAAALLLCLLSACDVGRSGGEITFRDDGDAEEDVAVTNGPSPDERAAEGKRDEPRRPKSRFAFPRAGSYVYSQEGYEEFCTPTCAGDPLPRTRSAIVSYGAGSRNAIVVIETTRVSSQRTLRTVTRHTRGAARVAEVVDTFTRDETRHRIRYRPAPTIETLELPLRPGSAWAGAWRGTTSGSYRMSVGGFDRIQTAGRSIRAARIVVRMGFRGRYDGYGVVTLWVDPTSRVTVASVGSIEVSSGFGRYTSDFDTRLRQGPGY